jgi:hypothetical protein
MAKGKQTAPEVNQEAQTVVSLNDEIVSLKDAGQKQARSHSLLREDHPSCHGISTYSR